MIATGSASGHAASRSSRFLDERLTQLCSITKPLIFYLPELAYSSYRHFGTARRCGAVRCGRAIKTIVASGSRPSPETPLNQRAVERTLCRDQSAHAGGWITRGEVLICTTDE